MSTPTQQQDHMFFTMNLVVPKRNQDLLNTPNIEKPFTEDDTSLDMDAVTEITESEMTEMDVSSQTSSCSSSTDDEAGEISSKTSQDQLLPVEDLQDVTSRSIGSNPGRRSILKRGVSDDQLYVNTKKGSWKCLPSPDLEAIRSKLSSEGLDPTNEVKNSDEGSRNSVAFGTILIRSYSQTLGDNPSVSYGPPIQLDWDYEEHDPMELDQYEDNRPLRRTPRQMVLSYYHRKNVLTWKYGVTEDELKSAKKQVKREKLLRNITITALPIMHVEAALESVARKAKRVFGKKSKSP